MQAVVRMRLIVLLTLSLAACGGRPLAIDGGTQDATQPDVDVWPGGGCYGPQDCPTGYDCKGCYPPPGCPMCAVCYGKCVPGDECWSNTDCAPSQFCNLDGGDCGKTLPGTCEAIPLCPTNGGYPTCGCDGKTYMAVCDAHQARVAVASAGPCNQAQCTAINKTYVATVRTAKTCCPMCNMLQCTFKVKADLACGCSTYVEDITAAASLKSLEAQWSSLGCDTLLWNCPELPCPNVIGGDCQAGTTSGTCQDVISP